MTLLGRSREKLSVARLGDAQVFLGIFVTGIEAQRFAELNNGLRDLSLIEIKVSQTVVNNRQLRIGAKRFQIMYFGFVEVPFAKKRIGQTKLSIHVIRFDPNNLAKLVDRLVFFSLRSEETCVIVMGLHEVRLQARRRFILSPCFIAAPQALK